MQLGWAELVVILLLVLLLVGARRLPELGRALGLALREFQDARHSKPDQQNPPKERQD